MRLIAASLIASLGAAMVGQSQEAPPQIIAPPNVRATTDRGKCEASVDLGKPVITGGGIHRSEGTRSDNRSSNMPFPTGETTVTWTLNGGNGEKATATQTVTVRDTEAPLIAAPDMRIDTEPATCAAVPERFPGLATDNCGPVTLTAARSDALALDTPYPKGTTTISWTAHDSSGNWATTTQVLFVRDAQPPRVDVADDVYIDAEFDKCSAYVKVENATASDNCTVYQIMPARSDGRDLNDSPYPVGTTTITWTAIDSAGLRTSRDQRVIVRDRQSPVLVAPKDVGAVTVDGKCVAFVEVGKPEVRDNCSGVTVDLTRTDGKRRSDLPYPRGNTTIDWKATDRAGNSASSSQRVSVKDLQAPVIATFSADTKQLWPANDRMVGVKLFYRVEDRCGDEVKTWVTVTSNERGAKELQDWEIVNERFIDLRAEHQGRVYTIVLNAIDRDGNQSSQSIAIPVAPPPQIAQ